MPYNIALKKYKETKEHSATLERNMSVLYKSFIFPVSRTFGSHISADGYVGTCFKIRRTLETRQNPKLLRLCGQMVSVVVFQCV